MSSIPPAVIEALDQHGLLLESDRELPSLVTLIAGGPVRGSWWGHPQGHAIYHVSNELHGREDRVVVVKLINRKLTYVARPLWPALLGVARARAPWQLDGLSADGRALLDALDREGEVRPGKTKATNQLQERLLAFAMSVHTESGHHEKVLTSWASWRERTGCRDPELAPDAARERLEAAAARLGPSARLPWQAARRRSPGARR